MVLDLKPISSEMPLPFPLSCQPIGRMGTNNVYIEINKKNRYQHVKNVQSHSDGPL